MPVKPQYNSRSGGNQFLKFAQTMCRLVNVAAPTIRAVYPTRTALLAVLTAAESVCEILPAALAEAADADAIPSNKFYPPSGEPIPGQPTT